MSRFLPERRYCLSPMQAFAHIPQERRPDPALGAPCAYLAGPMAGKPRNNHAQFAAFAVSLRHNGWDIINPAELDLASGIDPDRDATQEERYDLMREDLGIILGALGEVSAVILLPGWQESKGAQIEVAVAQAAGIPVFRCLTNSLGDGEIIALVPVDTQAVITYPEKAVPAPQSLDGIL